MAAHALDPDAAFRLVKAARHQAIKEARRDFHIFGPVVVQNAEGQPIEYAPLHRAWIAHVNYAWSRGMHAGIFSHFGSGKSSGFAVPLLSYLIGKDPQERIKIVCSGDAQAALRLQSTKTIMESPLYGEIFPGIIRGEKWNDHMMFVERAGHAIDPTIEARGVGTKATGARATTILFDDVDDIENTSTFEKRKKNKRLVEILWMSRLEPGGKVLWIATPWDLDDCSHHMMQRPDFVWLVQRVKADLSGYEQTVYNAGSDYLRETTENMVEMAGGQY